MSCFFYLKKTLNFGFRKWGQLSPKYPIRNIANKFGFDSSPNGRNLVQIKNRRNRLAHGEQTFYDVGRDFTVREIIQFKEETFEYLSDVIEKIESFILDKKYAISQIT